AHAGVELRDFVAQRAVGLLRVGLAVRRHRQLFLRQAPGGVVCVGDGRGPFGLRRALGEIAFVAPLQADRGQRVVVVGVVGGHRDEVIAGGGVLILDLLRRDASRGVVCVATGVA